MQSFRAGIIGATGYAGAELSRILLSHPQIELCLVAARSGDNQPLAESHPNLRSLTKLLIKSIPEALAQLLAEPLDVLFLAMPHGESMKILPNLPKNLLIIDLGADYRLRDVATFEHYYGMPHSGISEGESFVYGLPEVFGKHLKESKRIASPGCFATAIQLGLYPLAASGLLTTDVIVDAKTGSSGAGHSLTQATHHAERTQSFFAYKLLSHQHEGEILQTLQDISPSWQGTLCMQTHATSLVRGIFASIYTQLPRHLSVRKKREEAVKAAFDGAYEHAPFVRLVDGSPNVAWVTHSNFADIGWALRDHQLVVFVALDNLVKGAAGQAVQSMNINLGLDETAGLKMCGGHP